MSGVRGVCDDVICPFLHSGVVQVLKAGQVHTNDPFCCPNSPLKSSYIWFAGWPKPDSYRRAQNRLNTSWVKLCQVFSWRKKYKFCLAFFTMESMWMSHFRSWEMVVPRNLNDSTAVTVLFMMVRRGSTTVFLFKSTIISTVLSMFSSRLLWLHQTAWLVAVLDEADKCGVICKLQELDRGVFRGAVICVVRASTHPWGAPVLMVQVLDLSFPASLAAACLSGSSWSTDRRRWARKSTVSLFRTHCEI